MIVHYFFILLTLIIFKFNAQIEDAYLNYSFAKAETILDSFSLPENKAFFDYMAKYKQNFKNKLKIDIDSRMNSTVASSYDLEIMNDALKLAEYWIIKDRSVVEVGCGIGFVTSLNDFFHYRSIHFQDADQESFKMIKMKMYSLYTKVIHTKYPHQLCLFELTNLLKLNRKKKLNLTDNDFKQILKIKDKVDTDEDQKKIF
jgi:hypothetical protein